MVKVIMGLKGSGKTKQLVKDINEAVQSETGSVVCVEFGKKLTYDIDYRVRLIDAKEYAVTDSTLLKGSSVVCTPAISTLPTCSSKACIKSSARTGQPERLLWHGAKNSALPMICALPSPFPTNLKRLLRL